MKKFCWQQIPNTIISELLCNAGFDGVILDAEHSNFSNHSLFECIQTIKLCGKKCGVRFTYADDQMVRSCLDAGVDYAIFSTVDSVQYCEKIINICRYPRYGGKRGQGIVRENMWGYKELDKSNPKIVAMIESKEGIEEIEKIVEFDIDYFLIGMYDLSASVGKVGDFEGKGFLKSIKRYKQFVPKGKAAIHLVRNYKNTTDYENDFSFFAIGMDTTILIDSYCSAYRDAFGVKNA